ncbi:MAG: BlaI/MecI/CopY family transcriptional regulator, partial [Phycisphaerales bacterium]|nr:BlaI/MecI/CopY family transcriptional regulator [Phycisphaerales bacterium]
MASPSSELSGSELEVLRALWDLDAGTVREVLNHLHERGRAIAYTTVQTFLNRLEQKDVVACDRTTIPHVFTPLVSREKISRHRLRSLIDVIYDGAIGPAVLQLVQHERLSAEEFAELQRLVNRLDADARHASDPTDNTTDN